MIPTNLKKYFWDIDFNKLNLNSHKKYILERLLEIGDEKAAKWLLKNFKKQEISKILNSNRKISKKSLNFWKSAINK